MAHKVKPSNIRHHTKRLRYRSNCCWDVAV